MLDVNKKIKKFISFIKRRNSILLGKKEGCCQLGMEMLEEANVANGKSFLPFLDHATECSACCPILETAFEEAKK